MTVKRQLGDLLVEAGIISKTTLERALARQKLTKKKLGGTLEEMGVITEEEIADALAKQFGFKTVKGIAEHTFPKELLDLVPVDIAVSRPVFPLKRGDNMIALAITDPFDSETMEFLSKKTGMKIIPVLSTRNDILAAVKKYYLQDVPSEGIEKEKILVVEDTPAIAYIIQAALTKEGYHVILAHDGIEGLKLALTEKPDLILSDLNMPRMDGYGLLRNLRSNSSTAGIPVVLLTSKATPEEEHKALEFGFIDFVAKPVQPIRIVTRVRRALELAAYLRK